ncbi:serine hydrolase domain-containing protein [Cognatilysobacter lacus]|uniref:Beta-lactamase family protein n=1 Tax=Cognatilysobacter lacus TaxID=1643323 RepID=A0A5D8ZA07_9GAMM|nr:serine hydrolase domain-containing protein [Lysobacter lacus]TZF91765.1 beta-lactamase family protein [Lysobacter lacus]
MTNVLRSRLRTWQTGALAFLLPVALGTGAGAQTPPPRWTPPATAPAIPQVVHNTLPIAADFNVGQIETLAQSLVADQKVPGLAMAIVYKGRIVSVRGYGITDMQAAEPVDAHTVFRLASLSKAFAGTLTGLLVNDGSLRWDSKVTQYLPNFQLSDPNATRDVTVANVVSQSTGLPRNALDRDLEAYTPFSTLTQRLANVPLACAPGACYGYQNVAFSLIGDVVFAATGKFYGQEVQRRIFKPLGMNDASVGMEGLESSPRWAHPHVHGRGGWVSVLPKSTYYQVLPAAGVNASATDMAQWLIAHTGYRPDVLSPSLLATLHTPRVQTPSEMRASAWRRERLSSAGYGIGWRIYNYAGNTLVFHGGAVQGYRGAVAMLPDRDFGVALLWNSESSLPSALVPTILDRALGIPGSHWMKDDFDEQTQFVNNNTDEDAPGTSANKSTAAPR